MVGVTNHSTTVSGAFFVTRFPALEIFFETRGSWTALSKSQLGITEKYTAPSALMAIIGTLKPISKSSSQGAWRKCQY